MLDYQEYLRQREVLIEENANLIGNVLNENELKVNKLLEAYKNELKEVVDERHLYKMPVLRNESFWQSKLWKFCKDLPKGSDLHVHGTALLPAYELINFVCTRKELVVDIRDGHIYNTKEKYDHEYCFNLKEALDKNITTRKEIEGFWTLLNLKHEENVWQYFEKLFCLHESIEYSYDTYYAYYLYAFNYYVTNNIMHIEIHALLSSDYEVASNYVKAIRDAYYKVKDEHPELIVSIICASVKYNGVDYNVIENYLNNALKLKQAYKDEYDENDIHEFIIGFDLFNEEDGSLPLKEIAPLLLECKKKYPDFKYFLHCGESLYAQSNNLIDAYLLEATRVGHGMNLYRYPSLLKKYADKEICLECCLISNQSLRYVKDLRLHPGLEYLRRGLSIALCSDDPVYQEKQVLSDDFFAAIMCWDLNLADVKQLCINSLTYAGVDTKQKSQLIKNFKIAWDKFIINYLNESEK